MKTMKKLCALMMALFLTVGICAPSAKAAGSGKTAKYTDGYLIEKLLSQFQFVTRSDVTMGSGGHTVGAIAVGGSLTLDNTFGDAGIVPSYISNYVRSSGLGNGWHGAVPVKSEVVYYGTATGAVDSNWIQNAGYMNLQTGFEQIEAQSSNLSNGTMVYKDDSSINIQVPDTDAQEVRFVINFSDFVDDSNPVPVNIQVPDVTWFQKHICVVTIINAESTDFTFDGFSAIKINGEAVQTAFENLPGKDSEYGKQLNVDGMNMIWNFPDATGVITAQGLGGHLVAPKAEVKLVADYEGGVIANKISGSAEGHFYPMSKYLSGDSDPDAGDSGATATFSKKAVSLSGDELPGAELTLTYLSATDDTDLSDVTRKSGPSIIKRKDNTVIVWTSTSTPLTLSKLPDGEYVLSETAAPAGYKYATDIEFKIEGGKVYQKVNGSYSSTETPTLTMVDEIQPGELVVTVVDEKTGENVPDAEVEVTYPDGTKKRHKTGPDGSFTIEDAEPGDYDIVVKEVPDGYTVTQGKEEHATVESGERTEHEVRITITASNDPGTGSTPGGTTPGGGTTGDTPGAGSAGQTPGGGTGTTVTNGTTNTTNSTNKTTTDTAVRTGDDFNLVLPIVLLVVSALGIGIVAYRKKKSM